jgi:amino acid adenylation domain-containing protein/non-ribosomal peptide synthase protein (TIGR01720 family)
MSTSQTSARKPLERSNLTASQLMMWTGQQLQPNEPLYNMVLAFHLDGSVDPTSFARAFDRLVSRTDALRTVITEMDGAPMQSVLDHIDNPLDFVDFTATPDPQESFDAWARARCQQPFQLAERLFDAALVKLDAARWVIYLNQHHLITDAWSVSVTYHALSELYAQVRDGVPDDGDPFPQFASYIRYERELRDSAKYRRAHEYWQTSSAQAPPSQALAFYRKPPTSRSGRTERITTRLGNRRATRLHDLAASPAFRALSPDLARFQIFATVMAAYLNRITHADLLTVGTPAHNRSSAEFKRTAGAFIDMLPLRIEVPQGCSFARLNGDVALATRQMLMNAVPGACDLGSARTFSVVLNYITATFTDFAGMPARSEWIHAGAGDRNHVFRLQVHDFDQPSAGDDITLHFDVNVDVFAEPDRDALVRDFMTMLDAFLADPDTVIDNVALLPDDEAARIRTDLSGPQVAIAQSSVLEMFEQQVRQSPSAIAAINGAASITYAELDRAANRIADALTEAGVKPLERTAVVVSRSFSALAALLGCMKRGVAYVPIDPAYPPTRISKILETAQPAAVLTQQAIAEGDLNSLLENAILVDADERSDSHRTRTIHPGETAYILHTSGSTGTPKGVVVSHGALTNYITWAVRNYVEVRSTEGAVAAGSGPCSMPLFTSLGFDLTVTSIFVPLCSGGTVVVYEERSGVRDIPLKRVIEDNRVDIMKLTPSHLAIAQALQLTGSRIHTLILGGEDLKTDLARSIIRRLEPGSVLLNEYGPTEATVGCSVHRFDPTHDLDVSVPIGTAIDNTELYILDRAGNSVPRGVVGMLHVGGAGVADGYFDNTVATAAAFLSNPWRPGEQRYATGDLVRLDECGEIEYLGREDEQVKVRGVRVETGEIETAMTGVPGISEALVLAVDRTETDQHYCQRCGLDARHPDAHLDDAGVCSLCRDFALERDAAMAYFRPLSDLKALAQKARAASTGKHDSIMLLSGGKDSSYALCRAVEIGFRPLVFTLDNGYISQEALGNVHRIAESLGLDVEVGTTAAMNEIFVDSLTRFSNVCNGCFKTVYTLSTNLAHERGIPVILTGLSRGQIFETRLAEFFKRKIFDPEEIDRQIIEARKVYHRMEDAVNAALDTHLFDNDAIFSEVQFVDFYRYCESTLDEVYEYLSTKAPWIRPSDTGRSTNCLINEAGIHVHKTERGFHNYSLPYSWDVRLGHKERDVARLELEDDINTRSVVRILGEIGYEADLAPAAIGQKRLVAYYAAKSPVPPADLKAALAQTLPEEYLPQAFIHLDTLPLTTNGKVDRAALPAADGVDAIRSANYVAPTTEVEISLAKIWEEVLGVKRVGIQDDFFDLGGDSILNIQIVAAARSAGLVLSPEEVFEHTTIAALADLVGDQFVPAVRGPVSGPVPLLPMQRRFLEEGWTEPDEFCQVVTLRAAEPIDPSRLKRALVRVIMQHDALRGRFTRDTDGQWFQTFELPEMASPRVRAIGPSESPDILQAAAAELDIGAGVLVSALVRADTHSSEVIIAAHHLVVDAVSWWVLLADLEAAFLDSDNVILPQRTMALPEWTELLARWRNTKAARDEADYWRKQTRRWRQARLAGLPAAHDSNGSRTATSTISRRLDATATSDLLRGAVRAQKVQVPEILLAALTMVFGRDSTMVHGELLRVDIEGHGRESLLPDTDLLRTVGWFTSLYPIALESSAIGDPLVILRSVRDTLRQVPSHGAGYGVLQYFAYDAESSGRMFHPPAADLLFNYLGQWDKTLSSDGLLSLARPIEIFTGSGGKRPYPFEINAVVFRGSLRVDWTYDSEQYAKSTIERLADAHMEAVEHIVAEAQVHPDTEPTIADFPDADLSTDELSNLLDELGDGRG